MELEHVIASVYNCCIDPLLEEKISQLNPVFGLFHHIIL